MSEEDCDNLVAFMKNGLSINESLVMLEEERIHRILSLIDEKLRQGVKIDEFFYGYLPHSYQGLFSVFIQYLPFPDALQATGEIVKSERKTRESLIRGLLYPCLLFVGMCAGVLLFSSFVFPSMIAMAQGFEIEAESYVMIQKGAMILSSTCLCLLGFSIPFLLIILNRGMIVSTYRFLVRHRRNNILVQRASQDFARFFLSCHNHGISTMGTLNILMGIQDRPLVSYIARRLDWMMKEGKNMDMAMRNADIEDALVRFFHTAFHSSSLNEMMAGYLLMTERRTRQQIHRFSIMVQLMAYGATGMIIILVYRVLMLPVAMIGTI